MPLLSKQLKGYVIDGYVPGITNGKYPAGMKQFKEGKDVHSGPVQYKRANVRDNPQGAATGNTF